MSFEGIEKKFELLVAPDHPSLRLPGREFWFDVVTEAGAAVLSSISNRECDAYLLSESSLFVQDDRIIMITCGQTNLVAAVQYLMQHLSRDEVLSFIYERKNEHFPQLQHSRFAEDVQSLNAIFPGTAHCFGDPEGHHLSLFHLDRDFAPDSEDMTLEILMYELDSGVRDTFTAAKTSGELSRTQKAVRELLPGFKTEDHSFEPAGYSLNGIRGSSYFTVHITPEEPGSYASLETNAVLNEDAVREVITRTVEIFRPARFDAVLFQTGARPASTAQYERGKGESARLGCGYDLYFSHFFRRTGALVSPAPGTADS